MGSISVAMPGPPPVITNTISKTLKASIRRNISTKQSTRAICGSTTLQKHCKRLAPSTKAASMVSPGMDLMPEMSRMETVVLLSKLKVDHHIEIELKMDELDLTAAESKATYDEIKAYVLNKYGLKVSQLYIAQIKRKCGIIERKNYNVSKKEDAKVPQCPPEKEAAIMDALKHFQMI